MFNQLLMNMKKRLIPTNCENRATINYSMLPHFKSANIFRFFCLSLFRDKHYNVRKTLDELKRITGDSLSNFNSQFKDFLRIKHYYLDNGFENKTKRCIYHIPPMELKCVTFSRKVIGIELESEYIGFFMQLVLLSRFADIELTKNNIIAKLEMDKKTYEKYIIELKLKDLIDIHNDKLILKGEEYILETDFKYQRIPSTAELTPKFIPKFILKHKYPYQRGKQLLYYIINTNSFFPSFYPKSTL